MSISYIVNTLFTFYFIIIILRCFLSWIPNLDWYSQPLKTISLLTDPFLNIFRKIIPPIGGIDISPIIAIILLQVLQQILVVTLSSMGL